MYADRVEGSGKRSVKERLNGNSADNSIGRRQITGKRFGFLILYFLFVSTVDNWGKNCVYFLFTYLNSLNSGVRFVFSGS